MTDPVFNEENFRLSLRRHAAAVAALRSETRKRKAAEARVAICEEALANVWRWTNNGYPELGLLLPILRDADSTAALTRALDALQEAQS